MLRIKTWAYLSCAVAVILGLAPNASAQTLNCSSNDMKWHHCDADIRGGVQLIKQRSDAACTEGQTWDFDRTGIWVDRGCRADFQVGQGWGTSGLGYEMISCSSDDRRRHYCAANVTGQVLLMDRHSDARCEQGSSWGFDGRGIWVDRGCRADFAIVREVRHHHQQNAQVISCSSDDWHRHQCPVNVEGGVSLVLKRSGSPCDLGQGWGFSPRGIWVDHGCRADFAILAPWQPDRDWDRDRDGDRDRDRDHDRDRNQGTGQDQILNCSSNDMHRHYCPADTRRGVVMLKQRSGSECRQDYSWGFDQGGIWVDHGCRADFQIVH
jgi:hypothetical protein